MLVSEFEGKPVGTKRKLYMAVRWAIRLCGGGEQLIRIVPACRRAQPRTVTAPDDQVAAILAVADPHLSLAVMLARNCGLRVATIMRLAPMHCHDGHITVPTKNSAWTNVTITPSIAAALAGLTQVCAKQGEPILGQFGLRHAYQITRRLKEAQKLCGFHRAWSFHDLRRTFAHKLYAASNNDLRLVQAQMAHTSPKSTLDYLYQLQLRQPTQAQMQAAEVKRTA